MTRRRLWTMLLPVVLITTSVVGAVSSSIVRAQVGAGSVTRLHVPDAVGGKTVIGQLTVDRPTGSGYVTAFGCDDGLPGTKGASTSSIRSDLNYHGDTAAVWSNRLIVEADNDGDVCFFALTGTELIVDVNAVSFDRGIASFPNRRTDTRTSTALQPAGSVLRINVPEARGGQTVVGQLTVDEVSADGHLVAYPCRGGLPGGGGARAGDLRSDLNYSPRLSRTRSNRMLVQADANGDICIYTKAAVEIIVDINGVAGDGIVAFPNRRLDTRATNPIAAGEVVKIKVPEAAGNRIVIGQLTVTDPQGTGHMIAYPCAAGQPGTKAGSVHRSDLNFDGYASWAWSNRLLVEADKDGNICLVSTAKTDLVVDINGASTDGLLGFPNIRLDTRLVDSAVRTGHPHAAYGKSAPPFQRLDVKPADPAFAALTGLPAPAAVRNRPIIAAKVDNYYAARPQWGLAQADMVFTVNVEGVTRFIALFHSSYPEQIGPIRSARTTDLELLGSLNRPVFSFSGANPGVNAWIDAADASNWLADFSAIENGCYVRRSDRPGPHNLGVDLACAAEWARSPGPAVPVVQFDAGYRSATATPESAAGFGLTMKGGRVEWKWDAARQKYLRSQNGAPHLAVAGVPQGAPTSQTQIAADNVVELDVEYIKSIVDSRSPHALLSGTGNAVVHRNGQRIEVTWRRSAKTGPFEFFDRKSGAPVPLDPGVTWFEVH